MPPDAERKALNQSTFRARNEQLERGALELHDDPEYIPFLCECPRLECTQVVLATLEEYEQVRADGTRGLAVPGHEDLSVERVVAQNDRFVTTEKFGRAGEVHEENDPRQ